jgi:hypothetical protein
MCSIGCSSTHQPYCLALLFCHLAEDRLYAVLQYKIPKPPQDYWNSQIPGNWTFELLGVPELQIPKKVVRAFDLGR